MPKAPEIPTRLFRCSIPSSRPQPPDTYHTEHFFRIEPHLLPIYEHHTLRLTSTTPPPTL
jgi:hypothetical protein